jgi:hypothetical protein
MKYLKRFNESLSYSGGDVTKMPIIGTITTKPLTFTSNEEEHVIPAETYSIVETIKDQNGNVDVYVTNQWYKEYKKIPLLIHKNLVESTSF